jgi:hypothetical protein
MPLKISTATAPSPSSTSSIKDGNYEEIFESYSKIWRDANLAEFEKSRESPTQTACD